MMSDDFTRLLRSCGCDTLSVLLLGVTGSLRQGWLP